MATEGLGTWTGRRVIIPSQTDGEPQNEASLSLRSERQAPELLPQMVWQLDLVCHIRKSIKGNTGS